MLKPLTDFDDVVTLIPDSGIQLLDFGLKEEAVTKVRRSFWPEKLGETDAADAIEKAIALVASEKLESMNAGRMGYDTAGVGDLVADAVATG